MEEARTRKMLRMEKEFQMKPVFQWRKEIVIIAPIPQILAYSITTI
jgi:hypothetical protein